MTRKDVNGDQPRGGETTWTNTGATRYGRGQHKTGSFGDDMLRPSPNHGTQRLPNDDDEIVCIFGGESCILCYKHHIWHVTSLCLSDQSVRLADRKSKMVAIFQDGHEQINCTS